MRQLPWAGRPPLAALTRSVETREESGPSRCGRFFSPGKRGRSVPCTSCPTERQAQQCQVETAKMACGRGLAEFRFARSFSWRSIDASLASLDRAEGKARRGRNYRRHRIVLPRAAANRTGLAFRGDHRNEWKIYDDGDRRASFPELRFSCRSWRQHRHAYPCIAAAGARTRSCRRVLLFSNRSCSLP